MKTSSTYQQVADNIDVRKSLSQDLSGISKTSLQDNLKVTNVSNLIYPKLLNRQFKYKFSPLFKTSLNQTQFGYLKEGLRCQLIRSKLVFDCYSSWNRKKVQNLDIGIVWSQQPATGVGDREHRSGQSGQIRFG